MRPIRVRTANVIYTAPAGREEEVGDLPTEPVLELLPNGEAISGHRSRWRPTDAERLALALGADLVLDVWSDGHPPVRLTTTEVPLELDDVAPAVDALIAHAVAAQLAAGLRTVGYERTLEEVAAWSETDRRAVLDWMNRWGPDRSIEPDGRPYVLETGEEPIG